jgi:23S rRNA (cytidine1920-2'-O)/16S rRNA (cytidine1409-2'-O)-methyltransferase
MQKKLRALKKILLSVKNIGDLATAESLISFGKVKVNGRITINPDTLIPPDSNIDIIPDGQAIKKYVSRGGIKIEKVFKDFCLSAENKKFIDIGASTGGFTDFILQNGAGHVTAVDVGYGIIDWQLRNSSKVTLLERTNIKDVTPEMLEHLSDFTVVDVSFISLCAIFKKILDITRSGGEILMLVKPQFEADKEDVGAKGLVTNRLTHKKVLKKICIFISSFKLEVECMTFSKIKGMKGNMEYWIYLKKNFFKNAPNQQESSAKYDKIVNEVVELAHGYFSNSGKT